MTGWEYCRWLLLLTLMSLSGCSGCRPTETEKLSREELEKRRREQQDAIDLTSLMSLPTDSETKILYAKPGHWQEMQQQFKSNREDLQVVAMGSVARGATGAVIPGTNVLNQFTRRTSLPKGQTKTVEMQYFVPYVGKKSEDDDAGFSTPSSRLDFRTELLSWPLMTPILQSPVSTFASELKPHEYQLVVLSPQALNYEYLARMDAVYWRSDSWDETQRTRSYQVTLCKPKDNKYSFPHSMLSMTPISVIIWDDVAVDDLSVDQQNGIIDWLHWGGRLVISGPSSWSRLQDSFLGPYLPAVTAESAEFGTEAFAEISEYWAVEDLAESEKRTSPEPLKIDGAPVAGLRLSLNERGQWLQHSGEMVAESQVGRGRIVVTAFPMRDPRIYRWKYYSSLFSTGILRRPAREFNRIAGESTRTQEWVAPFTSSSQDPRLHTNVRILSRDLPLGKSQINLSPLVQRAEVAPQNFSQSEGPAQLETLQMTLNAKQPDFSGTGREDVGWGSGGAAWSDNSGLAVQAIDALRAAAGIELPSRKTIIYLLAGYLACLVPLNWLFFRMFRRLEFAWIAAPIMALIGVVVVTQVARLDIGFARRTTEISVLELHENHPRGHLTQYLALYTSLSTNYAVEFPDNGSVALPLGDIGRVQRRAQAEFQTMRTQYGRSEGVRLEPVTVFSNSTEMLHAEQIVTLPGSLQLGAGDANAPAIRNEMGIEVKSAVVIKRLESGEVQKAWIGDLAPMKVAKLTYEPHQLNAVLPDWENNLVTQASAPFASDTLVDSLWIGGVLNEILQKTPLMPGQTRLIGYTDERPGKLELTPSNEQYDGRCIVVVHLTPQTLGDIVPDKNIMSKIEIDKAIPPELSPLD
jgi:hypothetical protein